MKQVLMVIIIVCLLNISCKKDKQSEYYKAVVMQSGQYCAKGTLIKLEKKLTMGSETTDTFNAINLPDSYNVPGNNIEVKFKFDQSAVLCTFQYQNFQSIILTDVK